MNEPSATIAAATLASLPGITPARLRVILDQWADPRDALAAAMSGAASALVSLDDPALVAAWRRADALAVGRHLARRGGRVLVAGTAGYPIADDIPDRPRVLFCEGAGVHAFDQPRVAIVGTRAATPHGLADARDLGQFLARAGITVVSGMAIGIDGAAHDGALVGDGCPVGVVATGLDISYPRRHVVLHDRVRTQGLLLSEHAYGTAPLARRFPVRNRVIAALADVVVVVEATARGGARITAEHAAEYGRPVLAMPGSRRNPSATGCNELIRDGAIPLLEPADVVVALGFTPGATRVGWASPASSGVIDAHGHAILRALGGEHATADQLAARIGLEPDDVSVALDRLARAGRIQRDRGFVWPV